MFNYYFISTLLSLAIDYSSLKEVHTTHTFSLPLTRIEALTLTATSQISLTLPQNYITQSTLNRAVGVAVPNQKREDKLFPRTWWNTINLVKILTKFSSNHSKLKVEIETYSKNSKYTQQYLNTSLSKSSWKETVQLDANQQLPIPTITTINLRSKRGVNYTRLRDLLAQENWQEADKETWQIILQMADTTVMGGRTWLKPNSIIGLSCEDLRIVDQLWMKHSNKRFGFSIQKNIWESVGGSPKAMYPAGNSRDASKEELLVKRFIKRVGWDNAWYRQLNGRWNFNLTYNLSAPVGHLPVGDFNGVAYGGTAWWISSFAQRLETCKYKTF